MATETTRLGKYWVSIFDHRFFRYVYPPGSGYIYDIKCTLCKDNDKQYVDNNHGQEEPDPLMAEHLICWHQFIVNQDSEYPYVKICRECEAPLVIGEDQACAECLRYMKSCKDHE
tara:strand:+ start:353 stop:697 length:345 start_codon:yes stop_codon:yes gene_type:complete